MANQFDEVVLLVEWAQLLPSVAEVNRTKPRNKLTCKSHYLHITTTGKISCSQQKGKKIYPLAEFQTLCSLNSSIPQAILSQK